jgi:flavodoxin I
MMKGLVIYDSVFGNTKLVAEAVAGALGYPLMPVTAASREQLKGYEHLVWGSPTRGFRATEPMQNFIKALEAGSLDGVKVSTFDTRMDVKEVNNKFLTFMESIFGYAADPIAKGLVKKGAVLVGKPEGFFVNASEGPLRDGELERAAVWAKGLC